MSTGSIWIYPVGTMDPCRYDRGLHPLRQPEELPVHRDVFSKPQW